jgi:hypothetical protein
MVVETVTFLVMLKEIVSSQMNVDLPAHLALMELLA